MTTGARARRRETIAVESVGQPMAVDALAALLVARLRPPPALHVVPTRDAPPCRQPEISPASNSAA